MFTYMNTDGYSDADLVALNVAYREVIALHGILRGDNDEYNRKSHEDYVFERLLEAYDRGSRGAQLLLSLPSQFA